MGEIVTATDVSKWFGKFQALQDVSIQMKEAEVFGLLGSNGAGKSTLTKIMTGLLMPDKGKVTYLDYELHANYSELKSIFSVVPQEISCYYGFSVRRNFEFFGTMYGVKGRELSEKVEYLLDWLNLKKFEKRPVEKLSGGYKRLVNIGCSLVHDPEIIFMDEPTVGLDPKIRHLMWEKIKELKKKGKTICLTTHYLDEAQVLCDRVGLMTSGNLLVQGTPNSLISKYGGYRIVVIKLSKIISQFDSQAIINTFEDSQVDIMGNTIVISFSQQNSLEKISMLTQWLTQQGYKVLSSDIREPELEDVFMNLTGEKMRD